MESAVIEKNGEAGAKTAPVPSKLAHVVLRSPNFRQMVDWYTIVLSAKVSYENEALAFLTYDEEHHRIAIINMPHLGVRQGGAAGMDHIAFTFETLAELIAHYERLKGHGVLPFWGVNHGPTTSFYYRDPDQNQLEFQVENFDTLIDSNAFFASAEFAENPIGVDIDLEDLARRVHAGEPEAVLKKRPNIGPRGLEGVPLA